MADCLDLRPVSQACLDGEESAVDRERLEAHLHTCQNCREDVARAAWEVGLFLLNRPSPAGAGLSAGFTDRVMKSVREAPRRSAPAPATIRPRPSAPVSVPAPGPVPAPILPWRTWAAAAAFAAAAAAVVFVFLNGEPSPVQQSPSDSEGRGAVVACNGGALRWTDRVAFDRRLAGSAWIAKDEAVPALPGEYLHSPAPSSVQVRLPGGGQFIAGPSSSLSFSPDFRTDRTVHLLEGALTATAAPGTAVLPLRFEAPGLEVESSGALELSVLVEGGPRASARWFGARADARKAGTEPPAPPKATVLVFAREGAALVATSAGPVRNSLERHTLSRGQALVLREGRVFLQRGVDDDAPPEGTAGLPLPPDSLYFSGTSTLAMAGGLAGGGTAVMAAGPVRNSLERTLGDPSSDPEVRADALALYESVGGLEAVEAAAKAVDDPAVQVRCAAVRILALNSWADRPKALAALRRLAVDVDSTIAVFSIRALRALEDREAIPLLRTMVVDDDAPPEEVQVAAFGALVNFGDVSRAAEAASRLGRLDPESALGVELQASVLLSFRRLPNNLVRQFLSDPRSGVRAAALLAANDVKAALSALADPMPSVQLSGVQVLLKGAGEVEYDLFRPLATGSQAARSGLVIQVGRYSLFEEGSQYPKWLLDAAWQVLSDPSSSHVACVSAAQLLATSNLTEGFALLLERGTLPQKIGVLSQGRSLPRLVLDGIQDPDPAVRSKALEQVATIAGIPETALPTEDILRSLGAFSAEDFKDAQFKAIVLMRLTRERNSEEAFQMLLGMASSPDPDVRRASCYGLGGISDRSAASAALEALLVGSDRATAESAVEQVTLSARRNRWAGKSLAETFPSASPHLVVRLQIAQFARKAGVEGARELVGNLLQEASPGTRAVVLKAAVEFGLQLDFQVPELLGDPSALVRLRTLLALTGPSRLEAARSLSEDPAFWVQALALAIRSKEGDAAALEALRVLVHEQKDGTGIPDPLIAGLNADAAGLPGQTELLAGMAQASGSGVERTVDPDSAASLALQAVTAKARRWASLLASSVSSNEAVSAVGQLADCHLPQALRALASSLDGPHGAEPGFLRAVEGAVERLIGYVPKPSAKEWFKYHHRGYVDEREIRSATER